MDLEIHPGNNILDLMLALYPKLDPWFDAEFDLTFMSGLNSGINRRFKSSLDPWFECVEFWN